MPGPTAATHRCGKLAHLPPTASTMSRPPDSPLVLIAARVSRSAAGVRVPADGPSSDLHASAEHRAHRVTVLARRGVAQAG
jgi:hypothetical protein